MNRPRFGLGLSIAVALVLTATSVTRADIFFSGRVDVDPTLGGNVVTAVKEFSGFSGHSYTNLDPATGAVTALGFAQFSTSRAGLLTGVPASPSQRLVAVFALQGQFTGNVGLNQLAADFNAGLGQMRVYDFGSAPVIDPSNPATWVPNIGNLSQGVVATFNLTNRPDAIFKGPPGGTATSDVLGFQASQVNTASTTSGDIGLQGDATIKFLYESGTLLDFTPAGYLVNPASPDLLVDIDELLELSVAQAFESNAANLANLQTIFSGFLGVNYVKPGDTFNPTLLGTTGDTSQTINGGLGVPGSQVAGIPEPATILGFTLLCAGGLGFRLLRRRAKRMA